MEQGISDIWLSIEYFLIGWLIILSLPRKTIWEWPICNLIQNVFCGYKIVGWLQILSEIPQMNGSHGVLHLHNIVKMS